MCAGLTADSALLILTSTSFLAILDIRTMEIIKRFRHPLELGVISAVCPSTHWLVVGTTTGTLSLWDLRFGLLLKSWRASGGVTSCRIHPSKGRGRWIMVSIVRESDEAPAVEVYDVETAKLMETYEVRTTRPKPKSAPVGPDEPPDVMPSKAALIAELAAARPEANPATTPSVLALMVGQSFASLGGGREEDSSLLMSVPEAKSIASSNPGWMITAGDDRVIRYWDLAKPSEGFVLCGSPKEKDVAFKCVSLTPPSMRQKAELSRTQAKRIIRPDAVLYLAELTSSVSRRISACGDDVPTPTASTALRRDLRAWDGRDAILELHGEWRSKWGGQGMADGRRGWRREGLRKGQCTKSRNLWAIWTISHAFLRFGMRTSIPCMPSYIGLHRISSAWDFDVCMEVYYRLSRSVAHCTGISEMVERSLKRWKLKGYR